MKSYYLILLAFFVLTISSCQNELITEEIVNANVLTDSNSTFNNLMNENCGVIKTLIAGQHNDVGTVHAWNDSDNLYIEYTVTGGWYLKETHVYAGDCEEIPTTKSGNPKIGHFPYNQAFSEPFPTSHTEIIPLSDLDDCFCVVAHAAIGRMNEDGTEEEETAFADGEHEFEGNRWGTYFEHCKENCEESPPSGDCETAFLGPAIGVDGRCFIDDGFSRWGWMFSNWSEYSLTIGNYTYPIYAGAAHCDNSTERLVAYAELDYDNMSDEFVIEINTLTGFSIDEAHVFVGPFTSFTGMDDYPVNSSGNPTVAPGQYGNTYENINSGSKTIRISLAEYNTNDKFSFIVHTVICGE